MEDVIYVLIVIVTAIVNMIRMCVGNARLPLDFGRRGEERRGDLLLESVSSSYKASSSQLRLSSPFVALASFIRRLGLVSSSYATRDASGAICVSQLSVTRRAYRSLNKLLVDIHMLASSARARLVL